MRYGVINHKVLDTNPGSGGPFAPPENFEDLECTYRRYMVRQLRDDFGVRQHVAVVARRLKSSEPPVFIGPFAADAERVAWDVLPRLAAPPRIDDEE